MTRFPLTEQQIADIAPRDAVRYLRTRGWQEAGSVRYSARWSLPGRNAMVLVPVYPDLADYPNRMAELLEQLAAMEDRVILDVYTDMVVSGVDSQEIISRPRTPVGTVPLTVGANTIWNIRDLLMSAATFEDLDEPRLVLPRIKSGRVKAFLDDALLGPSKTGSYVFTVQIPVMNDPPPSTPSGERPAAAAPPFSRRVAQRLYLAVHAAYDAAARSLAADELDAFEGHLEQGVTADLCKALAGIAESSNEGVSVVFSWSPRLTVPNDFASPRVNFSQTMGPVLAEAAARLRSSYQGPQEFPNAVVLGQSVTLTRSESGGRITVIAGDDSSPEVAGHQIRIDVGPEQYDRAVLAHREHRNVLFEGTVEKRGPAYYMESVTRFLIIAS